MNLKNYLSVAVSAATLSVGVTAANAATFDLSFIMDSSGSVGSSNFNDAMDALADALDASIPVGGADTYRIGVVTFAADAQLTAFETIDSADDLSNLTTSIRNQSFSGGLTNYQAAFDLTRTTFGNSLGDFSIINMMTDGITNRPTNQPTAEAAAVAAVDDLRNTGWDSLSFESVGGGADNDFLAQLGYDAVDDNTPIFGDPNLITDPLNASFVLTVSDFQDAYTAAISTKVSRIVDPDPDPNVVPLPAGLPLVLTGLGLFGLVRARKQKAA